MQTPLRSAFRHVPASAADKRLAAEIPIRLASGVELKGFLESPDPARGLIVFVHGSGSSRYSVRNHQVAQFMRSEGFATLLMDLLTTSEDQVDAITRELRFNIPLLAGRVTATLDWLTERADVGRLLQRLRGHHACRLSSHVADDRTSPAMH